MLSPIGIGAIASSGGAGAASTLLTDLISYWTLNEESDGSGAVTRNDSHGSNHLTDNNTVTSAAGKQGNAASFSAINNEYLSRTSNASLQTGDIDFTFAAWLWLTTISNKGLIAKDNVTSEREFNLFYLSTSNAFRFAVGNGTSIETVLASSFGAASANTWYFVVAWHDAGTGTIKIQVNNGTVDSANLTITPAAGSADFRIGVMSPTSSPHDGRIDEVGFWKRILTADERTQLYNSGSGVTYADF